MGPLSSAIRLRQMLREVRPAAAELYVGQVRLRNGVPSPTKRYLELKQQRLLEAEPSGA